MAILDKHVKPLAMVHVQSADIEKFTPDLNASSYSKIPLPKFKY